ncbi:MAG: DUF1643 domain-containing protein [Cyanobacteria bacterium J06638_20]
MINPCIDRPPITSLTIERGAEFDPSGLYRYRLWRRWDPQAPTIAFVMLNPSTANAERDDPTIRRCMGFARDWGYGSLDVVNLFAFRATHPQELFSADDPVGRDNDRYLRVTLQQADRLILAWGNRGTWRGHHHWVLQTLEEMGRSPECLGITKQGQPCHPLYQRRSCTPMPYEV